ncbi:MAG: ATP-grasp domain-containing protein [Rhodospirillales bacterium]|nr:ATP-grasp domain-containing protein [Rhodospirillales bacterium]
MNKKDVVIFIESNTSGSGEDFFKIVRLKGLRAILLTTNKELYPWAEKYAQIVECNTNALDALETQIKTLAEEHNIKGIGTSSDYYIRTAAQMAFVFNLSGPDAQSIENTQDKSKMRKILKDAGLTTPTIATITFKDDIEKKVAGMSFPVVAKPVTGTGSEKVRLCANLAELDTCINRILSVTHNSRGQELPPYALVEEYIEGQEYSVELLCNPEPCVITVIKKHMGPEPNFLEIGHDVPAPISKSEWQSCEQEAIKAAKAMQLTFGCLHVELKLGKTGPVIIEINTRLAGGMLPDLIKRVYDIDLIKAQINAILDKKSDIPTKIEPKTYACIRFLVPPHNGKLSELKGFETLEEDIDHFIYDLRFKQFHELKGDFTDRIGALIVSDPDQARCIEKANTAVASIHYIYDDAA